MNPAPEPRHPANLPRSCRITSTLDFKDVFAAKRSVRNRTMIIFFRPGRPNERRIGLSVSRRFGGAVQRNRIKRIFREVFRQHREALPSGLDFVFVPVDGRRCREYFAVREAFLDLARKITDRCVNRSHSGLDPQPGRSDSDPDAQPGRP